MNTITRTCPGCNAEFTMRVFTFEELIDQATVANSKRPQGKQLNAAELISAVRAADKSCQSALDRVACDACVKKERGELAATDAAISYRKRAQACWTVDWEQRVEECFERSDRATEDRTQSISRAWEWAREWNIDAEKSWAIVCGPVGTGKTYLARCILNRAMQSGLSAREIEAADLIRLNNGWSENEKKMAALLKADVFLIEEVGLVSWTKDALVALRRVIDAAYKNKRRGVVLMTSNLSVDELIKAWHAPVKGTEWEVIFESMRDRMRKVQRLMMDGSTLRKGAQNNLPGVA